MLVMWAKRAALNGFVVASGPFAWIVTVPAAMIEELLNVYFFAQRFSVNIVPVFGTGQFDRKIRATQIVEVPKLSARRTVIQVDAVLVSQQGEREDEFLDVVRKHFDVAFMRFAITNHQMTCTPNVGVNRVRTENDLLATRCFEHSGSTHCYSPDVARRQTVQTGPTLTMVSKKRCRPKPIPAIHDAAYHGYIIGIGSTTIPRSVAVQVHPPPAIPFPVHKSTCTLILRLPVQRSSRVMGIN